MSTPKTTTEKPSPSTSTSTFDQSRRFTTDAYGIERLLRTLQSTLQILLHNPPPLLSPLQPSPTAQTPLLDLSARLGQIRRTIRAFRFLGAFQNGYKVFESLTIPHERNKSDIKGKHENENENDTKTKETATEKQPASSPRTPQHQQPLLLPSLTILSSTFDGLYYLLEALTLPDALKIPGLKIFPPHLERALLLESQRCWFIALLAGALACLLRLARDSAASRGSGGQESEASVRERRRLVRKLAASVLDLVLPGSVLGWIPVEKGTVGFVMLVTSVLTGWEVWERCGREGG